MSRDPDITSHYQKYFYMVKASTPELKILAYNIRYEVYYEEYQWPPHQQTGNNFESDIWDQCSIHGLLFHRPTNKAIGNVRLIPLDTSITDTLPIEEHCKPLFDFSNTPVTHLRQGRTGEISRMAIISSFRRRSSDHDYSYETEEANLKGSDKRFPINYMPMCLTFAAIILLLEKRLDYGVALMEPRLARLLTRYGVELKQIGEPIEHYGLRAPFLIFPEDTFRNLPSEYKNLFNAIKQELTSP